MARLALRTFVVGVLAVSSVLAKPQEPRPQQPGTVRSRITLVPLEVRVLDREGRPVTSLRESDFTVSEDDVVQRLQHFSTRSLTSLGAGETGIAGGTTPLIASSVTQRTFLILLGRGRLEEPSKGLTAAREFVKSLGGAGDRVGVMAYTRVTDATTDREATIRLLDRYSERHAWIEAHLDSWFKGLTGIYGRRNIPAAIQAKIDDIFGAPNLPRTRDLPLVAPPGDGEFEEARRRLVLAADPIPTGLPDDPTLLEKTRQDFERLFAAIEWLRYAPGDRHLIYVTEEPLLFGDSNLLRLTTIANDARVSVFPLQTGGVLFKGWNYPRGFRIGTSPPTFHGRSAAQVFALTGLRGLAQDSGGLASFYEPAENLFRVVNEATRFHYVLGYYPPTPNDGRYHRIGVTVNRDDVDVLYRRGYYARDEVTPTDPRLFHTHSRIAAAASYWREIRDIPLQLVISTTAQDHVGVRVRIDPSHVTFRQENGRHVASVEIGLFVISSNRELAGELRHSVALNLTGDAFARVQAQGICHEARIPIQVNARVAEVRAVAYDYDADRLGSATVGVGKTPNVPTAGCR